MEAVGAGASRKHGTKEFRNGSVGLAEKRTKKVESTSYSRQRQEENEGASQLDYFTKGWSAKEIGIMC